jgi:hypothetical protein
MALGFSIEVAAGLTEHQLNFQHVKAGGSTLKVTY